MLLVGKTASVSNCGHGHIGFVQETFRPFDTKAHEVLVRRHSGRHAELTREVAGTETRDSRDRRKVN